jgi:hypothetical protein
MRLIDFLYVYALVGMLLICLMVPVCETTPWCPLQDYKMGTWCPLKGGGCPWSTR